MLGRDHQQTSIGIAGIALFVVYKNQHVPIDLIFNHPNKGVGNFTYVQLLAGFIFLICVGFGSLLPDIDSKNSLINKLLPINLSKYFVHRGICHSLISWLIFCLISLILLLSIMLPIILFLPVISHVKLIGTMIYLGLIIGYFLHLLEDSFSRSGIIWLYPFGKIDQKSWNKYRVINRPVVRFSNQCPIRYWWGRGYSVGSNCEKRFANVVNLIGSFLLIWTVL